MRTGWPGIGVVTDKYCLCQMPSMMPNYRIINLRYTKKYNMDIQNIVFEFGTKAETLARLQVMPFKDALFCPQIIVNFSEWQANPKKLIDLIIEQFPGVLLVVRSSAACEDGWDNSMAGAFKSIANVAAEHQGVHQAITEVFGSYGGGRSGDQVLVQPMVQDVALSGVALSRDIEAGAILRRQLRRPHRANRYGYRRWGEQDRPGAPCSSASSPQPAYSQDYRHCL